LIRLFHSRPGGRAGRPAVFGAIALTGVLAVAGCSSSSSSGSSGSSSSSSSQTSAFRKCLEEHGVTPPSGHLSGSGGGTGTPHPRPTGSGSSSFRQAMQACGGSDGHQGSTG
jgi:hypothetical protein